MLSISTPIYISQTFCIFFTYYTSTVKAASSTVPDIFLFVVKLIAVIGGYSNANYLIMKTFFAIRTNPVCRTALLSLLPLKLLFFDFKFIPVFLLPHEVFFF